MTSYGPEREADRLRVIVETLAYAHPDMKLSDAAPMIFAIEERTAKLESPHVAAAPSGKPDSLSVAKWIATQPDIIDLAVDRKINAIKETRARYPLDPAFAPRPGFGLGLKEAKEGVEAFVRGDHLTK